MCWKLTEPQSTPYWKHQKSYWFWQQLLKFKFYLKYFNNLIEMYFNNIIGLCQKGFNCFLEQFSIPSKKIQPCFFLGLVISCQPHEAEPSAWHGRMPVGENFALGHVAWTLSTGSWGPGTQMMTLWWAWTHHSTGTSSMSTAAMAGTEMSQELAAQTGYGGAGQV